MIRKRNYRFSKCPTEDRRGALASECDRASPSHGENRGSSPLGSANKINSLSGSMDLAGMSYGKSTAYPEAVSRKNQLLLRFIS